MTLGGEVRWWDTNAGEWKTVPAGLAAPSGTVGPLHVTYTDLNAATDWASGILLATVSPGDYFAGAGGFGTAFEGDALLRVTDEHSNVTSDMLTYGVTAYVNPTGATVIPEAGELRLFNSGGAATAGEMDIFVYLFRAP